MKDEGCAVLEVSCGVLGCGGCRVLGWGGGGGELRVWDKEKRSE